MIENLNEKNVSEVSTVNELDREVASDVANGPVLIRDLGVTGGASQFQAGSTLADATVGARAAAYLIDWGIALPFKLICLIPILGWALAFILLPFVGAFELSRDSLFKGQSPGKKLLNLRTETTDGEEFSWKTSALRNLQGVLTILQIVPVVGYVFFVLHFIFLIVELILLIATGQRLGDRLAHTRVTTA